MEALQPIYEGLKGSRANISGRLTIPGFSHDDYESLYDYLITEVIGPRLPEDVDYYDWLARKAQAYHVHRLGAKFYDDKPDPLVTTPPDQLDTRQQLAILKFHIYRRVYSIASKKGYVY